VRYRVLVFRQQGPPDVWQQRFTDANLLGPRPALRARRGAGVLCAGLALVLGTLGSASRADVPADSQIPPQYRLADARRPADALPDWSGVAGLADRPEFLFTLPASFGFDSLVGLDLGDINALDRPRATVRYAWLSRPTWEIRVGLSTTLDPGGSGQRFITFTPDHPHVGALPTMHFSGQSRLADRWMLSVSAEGLRTGRGQGLDMDLRVDYALTRDFGLFGSYRLTDSSGDFSEIYGFLPSNTARFGLRLRF
jgi:hypothetical protein